LRLQLQQLNGFQRFEVLSLNLFERIKNKRTLNAQLSKAGKGDSLRFLAISFKGMPVMKPKVGSLSLIS
jgi:hypothetical protein